jgi:hypothetical protein
MSRRVPRMIAHDKRRKPETGFVARKCARNAHRRWREFALNG